MARHEIITKIDGKRDRRLNELALAAAALYGLVRPGFTGPIPHDHQALVMEHMDALFGFTSVESERASDMLFEATLNHAIADYDRPRILACATELTRIAANYRGTEEQDREIWAAGFELFETDSLWEASQPPARPEPYDPVFDCTDASHRYWGRI